MTGVREEQEDEEEEEEEGRVKVNWENQRVLKYGKPGSTRGEREREEKRRRSGGQEQKRRGTAP